MPNLLVSRCPRAGFPGGKGQSPNFFHFRVCNVKRARSSRALLVDLQDFHIADLALFALCITCSGIRMAKNALALNTPQAGMGPIKFNLLAAVKEVQFFPADTHYHFLSKGIVSSSRWSWRALERNPCHPGPEIGVFALSWSSSACSLSAPLPCSPALLSTSHP